MPASWRLVMLHNGFPALEAVCVCLSVCEVEKSEKSPEMRR